jgi:bacterioferritin-associated ferredoxin
LDIYSQETLISQQGGVVQKVISWTHPGREELELTLEQTENQVSLQSLRCIGPLVFLRFSQQMKELIKGDITSLSLPEGRAPHILIWREVILKIKGEWQPTMDEAEELCHCRKVSVHKVSRAIIYGAHQVDDLRARTSANTGCGTCLPQIEDLLKQRLGQT